AKEVRRGCGNVEVRRDGSVLGGAAGVAIVEAAAAQDARVTGRRADRICSIAGLIRRVPVAGPFRTPDGGILDAPCIGRVRGKRRVGCTEELCAAGAGDVLPLGLGGQTPGLAGLLCEPRAI